MSGWKKIFLDRMRQIDAVRLGPRSHPRAGGSADGDSKPWVLTTPGNRRKRSTPRRAILHRLAAVHLAHFPEQGLAVRLLQRTVSL
jgi:hypothetical protein